MCCCHDSNCHLCSYRNQYCLYVRIDNTLLSSGSAVCFFLLFTTYSNRGISISRPKFIVYFFSLVPAGVDSGISTLRQNYYANISIHTNVGNYHTTEYLFARCILIALESHKPEMCHYHNPFCQKCSILIALMCRLLDAISITPMTQANPNENSSR
jgi:hypothetical protein